MRWRVWAVAVALTAAAEYALRGWMIAREVGAAALSPHAGEALVALIQVAALLLLRAALIAEGIGGAILAMVWLGRQIAPPEERR